jgi:hypothetical protein
MIIKDGQYDQRHQGNKGDQRDIDQPDPAVIHASLVKIGAVIQMQEFRIDFLFNILP